MIGASPEPSAVLGRAEPRVEDRDLLRGKAAFVADIAVHGCLELGFARSPVAHGRLRGVDLAPLRSSPGVLAGYAAADLPRHGRDSGGYARPTLAGATVRFVGEPVAAVVADSRSALDDALELVTMTIDPLPAVSDVVLAAADEVRLFPPASNIVSVEDVGAPVDDVFREAPVIVELDLVNQRVAASSLEARGMLVVPDGSQLTVWCSHQAPHRLRKDIAAALNRPPDSIRVRVPAVGGAFGAKQHLVPEYLVALHAAMTLDRPIRWIESRREALLSGPHGRGQHQRIALAAGTDGRILALRAEIDADVGAYPATGGRVPGYTAWMMSGPYAIPRLQVRVRTLVTNAPPTSPYRGAGRPEATYALERAIDSLGRRLSIDAPEIRGRNFIGPDRFPYSSPTGAVYDSGRYLEAMDRACDAIGWQRVRAEQRSRGPGRPLLGIGLASYVERSGTQTPSTEFASISFGADGTATVATGVSTQGQGHRTSLAQLVAHELEIELPRVCVVQGDTAKVREGAGTNASQSLQVGGEAVVTAARRLRELAAERGAAFFGAPVDRVRFATGAVSWPEAERAASLAELVRATGPLYTEATAVSRHAFPFGCYAAVVEIAPRSGTITVVRLVAVDDCGVIVNPAIVEGQTIGSTAQGIGQALLEGIRFDGAASPLSTTLARYSLPTATDVPSIETRHLVTPNPNTVLGAKGAGESGCLAAPAALVNAVADALGMPSAELHMPLTPDQVRRLVRPPNSEEIRARQSSTGARIDR